MIAVITNRDCYRFPDNFITISAGMQLRIFFKIIALTSAVTQTIQQKNSIYIATDKRLLALTLNMLQRKRYRKYSTFV
jgi:hypothetical protein